MEKKWSAESKEQLDRKAIAAHFRETFPRRCFIFYLLGGFWEREAGKADWRQARRRCFNPPPVAL